MKSRSQCPFTEFIAGAERKKKKRKEKPRVPSFLSVRKTVPSVG